MRRDGEIGGRGGREMRREMRRDGDIGKRERGREMRRDGEIGEERGDGAQRDRERGGMGSLTGQGSRQHPQSLSLLLLSLLLLSLLLLLLL